MREIEGERDKGAGKKTKTDDEATDSEDKTQNEPMTERNAATRRR